MYIQKALKADANALTDLTLRSKAYWGYSAAQMEGWREELAISEEYIGTNHVYKVMIGDTIAGFYAYNGINEADIKLNFLFIEPEYIGRGCGKVLMTDFLKRIENSDYKRVLVDADPNAEAFYAKFGFKVIDKLQTAIEGRFLPVMAFSL